MATAITARRRAFDVAGQLPRDKALIIERSLNSKGNPQDKVKAFHTLYDMPQPNKYIRPDAQRMAMRTGLILEELSEFLYKSMGITMSCVFEVNQSIKTQECIEAFNREALEEAIVAADDFDPVEGADALGDLVYVEYGLALELGLDLDEVIDEIHAANMTKLGEDGNPIRREDGKVTKGPNYIPPNIAHVLSARLMIGGLAPEDYMDPNPTPTSEEQMG